MASIPAVQFLRKCPKYAGKIIIYNEIPEDFYASARDNELTNYNLEFTCMCGQFMLCHVLLCFSTFAGIILCLYPANDRWRYNVTLSLIGWAHTQNPCIDYNHIIDGYFIGIGASYNSLSAIEETLKYIDKYITWLQKKW